jgi:mannose-1-phosphate guanylyltransferase/mannose-6-phosphate isomerase
VSEHGYGNHIFVKRGTKHRIACDGSVAVEIIEVQVGDSFEESDIVRFSDDYGRSDG